MRCIIPTYDYACECGYETEIFHMMSDTEKHPCPECGKKMTKLLGCGYAIIHDKSAEGQLKRDIGARQERAKDMRNKPVSRSHSGKGSGKGKALGGQHFEVDKKEFVKAAARDPLMVDIAKKVLKKK